MNEQPKKVLPKGRKKGGTVFPRIPLSKALEYSQALVSRTHTGPLARALVFVGVFGEKGSRGEVRASALKQFGLLESRKDGFVASPLARSIDAAPPEERDAQLQRAALSPSVFKALYDTFKGGQVSRAKIRQQAINLRVHPDNAADCVENFVSSLTSAALAQEAPDGVTLIQPGVGSNQESVLADSSIDPADDPPLEAPEKPATDGAEGVQQPDHEAAPAAGAAPEMAAEDRGAGGGTNPRPHAVFQVNVTLDSSLDTEKLEKQLQLLRRYGAL